MKIAINVRDDVLRRSKARAALLGQPLSRFMEAALERLLREEEPESSSCADWAANLPTISREAAKDLNSAFSAPDFRPIDPEMWK